MRTKLLDPLSPLFWFTHAGNQIQLNPSSYIVLALKFEEFWDFLARELASPAEFSTQSKQFSAKYSGGRIVVTTSDDSLWTIERSTLRKVWEKAMSLHESTRFNHANYNHDNIRTSSYIVSIMKKFLEEGKME